MTAHCQSLRWFLVKISNDPSPLLSYRECCRKNIFLIKMQSEKNLKLTREQWKFIKSGRPRIRRINSWEVRSRLDADGISHGIVKKHRKKSSKSCNLIYDLFKFHRLARMFSYAKEIWLKWVKFFSEIFRFLGWYLHRKPMSLHFKWERLSIIIVT